MIVTKDYCVDCDLPCLGHSCPNKNVLIRKCDFCEESAIVAIDGNDMCETCAQEYVKNLFNELSLSEALKLLSIDFKFIK